MRGFPSLAGALLTILTVGVALALAQGRESEPSRAVDDRAGVPDGAAALAPQLPELVSAFRRHQTLADRLPGNPAQALDDLGDARPGESPQFARRLPTAHGDLYAWPASDAVCYAWPGSTGCTPTTAFAQHGVLVGLRVARADSDAGPEVSVAGLARDGIERVELVFEGGHSESVAIAHNAFLSRPSAIPAEVRWTNPDGTRGARSLPSD